MSKKIVASLVMSLSLSFLFVACGGVEELGTGAPPDVSPVSETGQDAGVPAAEPDASTPATPDASTPAPDAGKGSSTHTLILGGVGHKPGNTDPMANCSSCHGADLNGGTTPSGKVVKGCYVCHDSADHSSSRGGVPHRSGSSSTCNTCHGPSNGGGLGGACSTCH